MARVPASKQTRKQLEQLFNGRGSPETDRGELVKLAGRLIVEEALEEEVEDAVARGYYKHGMPRAAIATAIDVASSTAPKAGSSTPCRRYAAH